MHDSPHPEAGKTVIVLDGEEEIEYQVEDWWDRVYGASWMYAKGNPACMEYAIRSAFSHLPVDDEVVYGHVGPFGHLIHVSEILKVVEES